MFRKKSGKKGICYCTLLSWLAEHELLYFTKGELDYLKYTSFFFFLLSDENSITQEILLRNWLNKMQKAANRNWVAANCLTSRYDKNWKQHVIQILEKGRVFFLPKVAVLQGELVMNVHLLVMSNFHLEHHYCSKVKVYNGFQTCQCLKKCFWPLNIHATIEQDD